MFTGLLTKNKMEFNTQIVIFIVRIVSFFVMQVPLSIGHDCDVTYGADMMANCSSRDLNFIPYDLQHNIAKLDLHSNHLGIIDENAFVKYDQLYSINLENNSLTEVKNNAFLRLKKLKYLNLSRNKLKSVPSGAFKDLSSLLLLNLRGNMISVIEDGAFVKLHSLAELHLDGNYIELIAPDAFKGLNFLQVMNLQNNALKTLSEGVVKHLTHRMKEWRLHSNPWYCDCKIRWFYSYLMESKSFDLSWKFGKDEPKCNGPPIVKDQLFSQLNQSFFVCQIEMYSSGHQKETSLGENVDLFCKYFSNPFIQPVWLKNEEILSPFKDKVVIQTTGQETVTSILSIKNFQYSDIGDYKCFLENARGSKFIQYSLSIPGVDLENLPTTPENSSLQPLAISESQSSDRSLDQQTIVIIVSAVCGFIFMCIILGFIIYICVRVKRKKRLLKEERSLTFKEHLKTTILNESNIRESKSDLKLETTNVEEKSIEKEPLNDVEAEERNDINTYVSFKPEYPETEDQFYSGTNTNRTKESDSSNCESTSPLLDNFSPIKSDSYDPLFESTPHSFYNMPKASTLNSRYLNSESSYDTYLSYTPYSTLSHTGPYSLPPHGHIVGALPSKRTSVSAGYLNSIPPKKPPRLFHSRDNMSLTSQNSQTSDLGEQQFKLSLPKPGTVDSYGTAV